MSKFHQDIGPKYVNGRNAQIWSFGPQTPNNDIFENKVGFEWKICSLCLNRALNHFQMTKFHQDIAKIVILGEISKYGHLAPDPPKMKIFKIYFFHVNRQTITLQTSPQPLS